MVRAPHYRSLSSIFPNADDLLALEVEDLAGVLLLHLNCRGFPGGLPRGCFSRQIFFDDLRTLPPLGNPEYGDRQQEVNRALMEAWAWLEREGLLIQEPLHPMDQFFISRRGQRLTSLEDYKVYRKAGLLPKGQLHPLLAGKVYPAFLRGDYDVAVFQSFKEVEVAVRDAGGFGPDDYGTDLMRNAFKPAKGQAVPPGPLTDAQLPTAEQEATANLFAGAIGFYKNPQSHRHVPTDAASAAEVILFASQLLRIVDSLRPQQATEHSHEQ